MPHASLTGGEFWWNERKPDQPSLWDSEIRLGEDFFNEIINHPVPIDMNTLTALKRSPLGLDLYLWLTYRTFALRAPLRLSWQQVYRQFGVEPDRASDKVTVQNFRRKGAARVEEDQAGLAGVELRDRSGRLDPLALDFDDRSGGCVATAGPIAFTGSSGSGAPQRRWCFGGGETTDFDGKAKNPHHGPNQGRTRGGRLDAVRALRPARAGGHRRSVVQEMPPGRQQKN